MAYGLKLSPPRLVMTRFGERSVQQAVPTQEFWAAWRERKQALQDNGYSVSKTGDAWVVSLWQQATTEAERAAAKAASHATDAEIDISVPAGRALLPYQKAGVAYALAHDATLIGDEMGLGKTIQAIAVANQTHAKRVLVLCPASLKLNWRNEIRAWQTEALPITVVNARDAIDSNTSGWVIINYDIAQRYPALKQIAWDLVIFDECHRLKNAKAQRTKFLFGYKARGVPNTPKYQPESKPLEAKRRLLLTGTPIVNRPAELFPLLHYLDPQRWGSFMSYGKRYCAAHHNGYGWDFSGASNLPELQDRLRSTCLIRRLKKDVLTELPPKRRQVITIETDDNTRLHGLVMRETETQARLDTEIARARTAVLEAEAVGDEAAYRRAVEKLNDLETCAFTEMSKIRHELAVAKVPQILEHLAEVNGDHKIVIFAHHRDVVEQLIAGMETGTVVSITGDTPIEKRQEAVERFQNDPAVTRFVGNIQAAGVGLTLTAASHVVFAELDWVPGNMTQAEDRCHRIGQHDSVLVQHLVVDGSLDARMAHILIAKQDVIDKALDVESEFEFDTYVPRPTPARSTSLPEVRVTAEQKQAVHQVLRLLTGMDADHATVRNDIGFNGGDTNFGHALAANETLTDRQAAAAMKMVRKYKRQYSPSLYQAMYEGGEVHV